MRHQFHRLSRRLLPLAVATGFLAAGAQAADLGIVTSGPTTLQVGVTATFTHVVTDYVYPLPANVSEKVVTTTTSNLGLLTGSGTGWITGCPSACTRATAILVGNSFPTITITTTPTATGPFKICGIASFVPNPTTQPDLNPANDQSCVSGTVKPGVSRPPDVAIKKGYTGNPTYPGIFHFVIETINNGPGSVASGSVKVVDNIDPNFVIGGVTAPSWTCPVLGQNVTCTYNGLAVGANMPFPQILIEVKTRGKGRFKNGATITYYPPSGQPPETVLGNNTASIQLVVN